MNIRRAEFLTSMSRHTPGAGGNLPEIAMAGKSNVGKSSLINRLAGNKKLARTSAEPGKTRLINLYKINNELILTDLPGYGFAKCASIGGHASRAHRRRSNDGALFAPL